MSICYRMYSSLTVLFCIMASPCAHATEVSVAALFPGKAVVSINGGNPRMLSAGQSAQGVKLISADSAAATFEIDGRRRTLSLGQGIASDFAPSAKPTVTLVADVRGHFVTAGSINGASTRFLVDTGSTTVAVSSALARQLGISYLAGRRGYTNTANGPAAAYQIMLDSVRVGDIVLHQVEGTVIEGNALPIALLGMSFLKRLEMKREGSTLTLVRQY